MRRLWWVISLSASVGMVASGCSGDAADRLPDSSAAETHEEGEEAGHVVHLDSAQLSMAEIVLSPAVSVRGASLSVTGTITYDANRVSHVGPRIEGRITQLAADLGTRVTRGAPLAILESADVGVIRANLQEASVLANIAAENFEREQRLEAQGISSRRELLDARGELERAQTSLQAAESRLQILGATRGSGGEFALTAPFDGVVVEKHASRGEVAGPTDQIFTIADLSSLWIELNIFERDLPRVRSDQAVNVSTAAYPNRSFPGRIVYVGDILDPATRTVHARVEIVNPDGALKPGMYARAEIETGDVTGPEQIVVPRGAVQTIEDRTVVWVPGDHPGEFRPADVQTGREMSGDLVVIQSGLLAGDSVVTGGAFTLTSELSRGEFGGHSH